MIDIWWIVALSVAVVLVSILVFKMHAFLTLLLAGLIVGGLTGSCYSLSADYLK